MTTPQLIARVNAAKHSALTGKSNLDSTTLEIAGFSTKTMRRFFNALCSQPVATYVEVGAYCGGTACAAMCGNTKLVSYVFEDFSQPFGMVGVKEALLANLETVKLKTGQVHVIEQNCFEADLSTLLPIEVLFYDGLHEQWAQRKAWSVFAPHSAANALVLCDDFSWPQVEKGCREGIADVAGQLTVEREWVFGDGGPDSELWHNDLAVFVVSRK